MAEAAHALHRQSAAGRNRGKTCTCRSIPFSFGVLQVAKPGFSKLGHFNQDMMFICLNTKTGYFINPIITGILGSHLLHWLQWSLGQEGSVKVCTHQE